MFVTAYYFRAHTYAVVPRHVGEDMAWMADHGTDAVAVGVLEQDLSASVENMQRICEEAHRAGVSVYATPSRWGGPVAGCPKVPSIFCSRNPGAVVCNPDGSANINWLGTKAGVHHPATFELHRGSLNFVPHVTPVFQEVARVIRPRGHYYLQFRNPFTHFSVDDEAWNGEGYPLKCPYVDGAEVTSLNPDWEHWDVETEEGTCIKVRGPREFRHTLSTVINGLVQHGFVILGAWEDASGDLDAKPGTWEHFTSIAPPWLSFWTTYRPEILEMPQSSRDNAG